MNISSVATILRFAMGLFLGVGLLSLSVGAVTPASAAAGDTWTSRTAAEANTWQSVTYGSGKFVAVADSGANQVMTSPDGITWTPRRAVRSTWTSVTFGNGRFVAVARAGTNRVMTSPDGITWTPRAAELSTWKSVAFGNGRFVAVAWDGANQVMTSPDGIRWSAGVPPERSNWASVTFGNGKFVAVSSSGSKRAMTSRNGASWSLRNTPAENWTALAYGNGTFVAVARQGVTKRVMTSANGDLWASHTAVGPNAFWESVTYGDSRFVAVASFNVGTSRVMTSPDGSNWTVRSAAAASGWKSVTYARGMFVAVAMSGTNRVMTSGALRTVPRPPTGVTAAAGNQVASVSWTPPTNTGGLPISGYKAVAAPGGARCTTGGATSCTVTGLNNGTTYTFTVKARNDLGPSNSSAASNPITPSAPPTATRMTVKAKAVKNRSKIRIDVNPNQSSFNYEIKVQKKVGGNWKTKKTTRTKGTKDKRTINMPKGKYRIKVASQHGLKGAKSKTVRLRR